MLGTLSQQSLLNTVQPLANCGVKSHLLAFSEDDKASENDASVLREYWQRPKVVSIMLQPAG